MKLYYSIHNATAQDILVAVRGTDAKHNIDAPARQPDFPRIHVSPDPDKHVGSLGHFFGNWVGKGYAVVCTVGEDGVVEAWQIPEPK